MFIETKLYKGEIRKVLLIECDHPYTASHATLTRPNMARRIRIAPFYQKLTASLWWPATVVPSSRRP